MVLGYHVVLGLYGFWLPNDPRGFWSEFVWADDLRAFGPATKVTTRRSLASDPHDHGLRRRAKRALKHPPVVLSDAQIALVAAGIETAAEIANSPIWACGICREHLHLVIGRSGRLVEQVVAEIKQRATLRLGADGLHPMEHHRQPAGRRHSPWARGFWKVYLSSEPAVHRAIQYAGENPEKDGLPRQDWRFVRAVGESRIVTVVSPHI